MIDLFERNPMRNSCLLLIPCLLLISACNQAPQEIDASQTPPLLSAAESGDIHTLDQLLKSGYEVDSRDSCQWTPLMKASLNGHLESVKRLIAAGAAVNLMDQGGYTAMMLAASNNHAEIVQLLLEHGAEVNQVENTNGWTALIWAANQGHLETIKVLLDHQANPGLKDHALKTAEDWAMEKGFEHITSLIRRS
jgi:ankyrin repeat protein